VCGLTECLFRYRRDPDATPGQLFWNL